MSRRRSAAVAALKDIAPIRVIIRYDGMCFSKKIIKALETIPQTLRKVLGIRGIKISFSYECDVERVANKGRFEVVDTRVNTIFIENIPWGRDGYVYVAVCAVLASNGLNDMVFLEIE